MSKKRIQYAQVSIQMPITELKRAGTSTEADIKA